MDLLSTEDVILTQFEQLQNQWTGCDWPTKFGPRGLNLCGIAARQAALVARATSGQESVHWSEAAKWLTQVESDAEAAWRAAASAAQHAVAGQFKEALADAEFACELEQRYRRPATWEALESTIRQYVARGSSRSATL